MQDHKIILRSLDILEEMAAKIRNGELFDPKDVEAMLHFLRAFDDGYHQTKEETALFPQLMQSAPAEERSFRQMLFEHDQERSLVEGLEEALRTGKGMDFIRYAQRLSAILRNHICKEENILFDIVEKFLSKEQDEKIADEFEQFDRCFGVEKRREVLDSLRKLEWKYLKKSA
jgi:hemerythrin-like domain-containing protein